ncbi:MAG: histidine kinase [Chitinophagales bacterium]
MFSEWHNVCRSGYAYFRKWLLLSCFCFSILALRASHLPDIHYTTDNGLPGAFVYCILQDHLGYIWFGTDQGLCRFDGNEFKTYTVREGLTDNDVFSLTEDQQGRIWAVCFHPTPCYFENDSFHAYPLTTDQKVAATREYPSGIVNGDDGTLYLLCSKTLYQVFPDLHKQMIHQFEQFAVGMAWKDGCLYVNESSKIWRLDKQGQILAPALVQIENEHLGSSILILGDSLYYLVHHHANDEIFAIDRNRGGTPRSIWKPGTHILQVNLLGDSVIMGYGSTGQCEPLVWKRHDESLALKLDKPISSLFIDRSGNKWVTTLGDGIYLKPATAFQFVTKQDGLASNDVRSITGKNGTVVVGFGMGAIDVLKGNAISHYTHPIQKQDFSVYQGVVVNGVYWLATDVGVVTISDKGYRPVPRLQAMGNAKCIAVDKQGQLLVGNTEQAYRYNPATGKVTTLLKRRSTSICEWQEGTYLLGTIEGLYCWKDGRVDKLANAPSLQQVRISAIAKDYRGNAWVATNGYGLYKLSGNGAAESVHVAELKNKICLALFVDTADRIWVGTNKGLVQIIADGNSFRVHIYNQESGLLSSQINTVWMGGGKVWMGTPIGLASINEAELLRPDTMPLPLYLTSISVGDSNVRYNAPLRLNYRQNDIAVRYTAIDFGGARAVVFQYTLYCDGRADTMVTHERVIRFNALQPGAYRLEIKAMGKNGRWSKPLKIQFDITAPFWRTVTFYIGSFLFVLIMALLIVRWRWQAERKKLNERNQLNKRIAALEIQALRTQMNPHFIFNALNSIQHFYTTNDELAANKFISTFSILIRRILHASKKNLITIREETEMLNSYLELEKMRLKGKFNFSIQVDSNIDSNNTFLPVMLLQPYIENAIIHGFVPMATSTGLLRVEFALENQQLRCLIDDNGVGMQHHAATTNSHHVSVGMQITRERVETLNAIHKQQIHITVVNKTLPGYESTGVQVMVCMPVFKKQDADEN